MVSVTAYWSEDDAESTLVLSDADWAALSVGATQVFQSKGFYEGEEFDVEWSFSNSYFCINGFDGRQCVVDETIQDLVINDHTSV